MLFPRATLTAVSSNRSISRSSGTRSTARAKSPAALTRVTAPDETPGGERNVCRRCERPVRARGLCYQHYNEEFPDTGRRCKYCERKLVRTAKRDICSACWLNSPERLQVAADRYRKRHPMPEVFCPGCGKLVEGDRSDKKYCSKSCQDRDSRNRQWPKCVKCNRPNKRGGKTRVCQQCKRGRGVRLPEPPVAKVCPMCRTEKPADEFYRNLARNDWLSTYCKACWSADSKARYPNNADRMKDSRLRSRYGITLEEYEEILLAQGNKCAICGARPKYESRSFSVDHSHEDGRVRGILCVRCNKDKLGNLTLAEALAIVAYLEHPPVLDVLGERLVPANMVRPARRSHRRKNRS